jgi:hypothetical protein
MGDTKVTVAVPRQTRNRLKAALALRGESLTTWLNRLAEQTIAEGIEQESAIGIAETGSSDDR